MTPYLRLSAAPKINSLTPNDYVLTYTANGKVALLPGDLVGGGGGSSSYFQPAMGIFDLVYYGAIGDGVADDSAAIQAAINAAAAAGGGIIRGRSYHTYDIGNVWPVISAAGYVIFDMEGALIRYNGAGTTVLFEVLGKGSKSVVIRNARFEGSGSASGDIGLRLRNCQTLVLDNLRFINCQTGLDLVNDGTGAGNPWNEQHDINNCEVIGSGVGVDMRAVNGGDASFAGIRFRNTTIANTATHWRVQSGMSFYGGTIDNYVGFFSAAGTQTAFDIQGGMTGGRYGGRVEETGASSTPQFINVGASGSIAGTEWSFNLTNSGFLDPIIANASATVPSVTQFSGSGAGALSGRKFWQVATGTTPTATDHLVTKAYSDTVRTVALGGTGRATSTTAYGLLAAGTTATGAHQTLTAGTAGQILRSGGASALPTWVGLPVDITAVIGDETTDITTGVAKYTMRAPWAFTITAIRASLSTTASSGIVTVDIKENGVSIMTTTKLTIDATEKTTTTAAVPAVITDTAIADDAELTFDIVVAGTGAKGLKVVIYGTRTI